MLSTFLERSRDPQRKRKRQRQRKATTLSSPIDGMVADISPSTDQEGIHLGTPDIPPRTEESIHLGAPDVSPSTNEERIDLGAPDISPSTEDRIHLDPVEVKKHFDRIGRFRILVIGRSNAGKTTLLQRVCNTTELLDIFNANGEKVKYLILLYHTSPRITDVWQFADSSTRNPGGELGVWPVI